MNQGTEPVQDKWLKFGMVVVGAICLQIAAGSALFEKYEIDGFKPWESLVLLGTILGTPIGAGLAYLLNPTKPEQNEPTEPQQVVVTNRANDPVPVVSEE